jgi:pimeloyl-ACP methyl ester carboxylesterase
MFFVVIHGCTIQSKVQQSNHQSNYQEISTKAGLSETHIQTQSFTLKRLSNPAFERLKQETPSLKEHQNRVIHVYLEGDGRAWINRNTISMDPTPIAATGLALMSLDPNPALYISRPCHFQQTDKICHPLIWTHLRYSQTVIDALAEAIRSNINHNTKVTLIGYSGGGTLAWLLARELKQVSAIVTLAGNMNTQMWYEHHHYSPLVGSQDPSHLTPLPGSIAQLHLSGSADTNILADWTRVFSEQQGCSQFSLVQNASHSRGWLPYWQKAVVSLPETIHHILLRCETESTAKQ